MKLSETNWNRLRELFLESVESSDMWEHSLRLIVKLLPKQQLAEYMYEDFSPVFEHIFDEEESEKLPPSETESDKTIADLATTSAQKRALLEEAWKEVEMWDFGILSVRLYEGEELSEGESPKDLFFFIADDMEILIDEATLKMKEFVKKAEAILGFPVEYDFDGYGRGDKAGEISTVMGRAKK